ncbi:hypothetical protein [Streptomyces sp. YGL11-2]|uniref:hypothetical protein n=1 Tax=Streptomyces sp. YGL11-2 TaxID=3414028 RepID=UPI003CFB2C82
MLSARRERGRYGVGERDKVLGALVGEFVVVGDQDDGRARPGELGEHLGDGTHGTVVEAGGRLVEDVHLAALDER